MQRFPFLFFLLLLAACSSDVDSVSQGTAGQTAQPSSLFTNYELSDLTALREAIKYGETPYLTAYENLLKDANESLQAPIYSVLQKKFTAVSEDKHDYLSLAPYWWPDPAKKDGLPWIRRDGEVNPDTKNENTDDFAKDRAFENIVTLAQAAFFSGEKKYARRAVEQLDVWFVDTTTRMNPNLNFAQGIPGRNDGRCFGVIEFTSVQRIISALEMLESINELPEKTNAGMRQWLSGYLGWLRTNPMGIKEGERDNNHGTWYDVQLVCMLRYLGRPEEARQILEAAKSKRIALQIEPGGAQPLELERTKSLSYSRMNLEGMTRLAWHGRQLGVDLWNYQTDDGRSIRAAYEYLRPFAFEDAGWDHPQLGDIDEHRGRIRQLFYNAGGQFDERAFCALKRRQNVLARDINQLCFSCQK